jgi:DNA-binding MarR family transcriptional regulator
LLRRETDQLDLRRGLISISSSGRALIDDVAPRSEAVYREITGRFGSDKLALLQALLAELEIAMAGADEIEGKGDATQDSSPPSRPDQG